LERFGGVQVRDRDNKAGRSVGRRSRLTLGRLCALFNESGDLVSAPGLTSFMDMVERRRELERLGRLQPSGILVCLSCTCKPAARRVTLDKTSQPRQIQLCPQRRTLFDPN
jgi:hypothetical protein